MTDGHGIVSLDLAIARAFCGVPSSFQHFIRIPMDLAKDMEKRLGVSQTALHRALSDACKAGILRKIGGRPRVRFFNASRPKKK